MIYTFLILFSLSFMGTYYSLPHSIRKLRESGYLAKDMYKSNKSQIPTNAGIILVFTSFISISLFPLFARLVSITGLFEPDVSDLSETNLAFLLVISIFALYGLVDDLIDIGRILKVLLPVTFCYPLISVINPSFIFLPFIGEQNLDIVLFYEITKGDIFRITIIPVYVMVVANLVNMHSGYNGLQSGLSIIIVFTLLLKSYMDNTMENIFPAASVLGAMVAFYFSNKFPAKVFEGNIGSLFFGSLIGSMIVVQEYWWFGFFILIPHTINFILWIYWLLMMRIQPDIYLEKGGKHQKFGRIRRDGTLEVPNRLTLKWIPNYYFNITEKQSTNCMHILTGIFCIMALKIF